MAEFRETIPIADWPGPVGSGVPGASCFPPLIASYVNLLAWRVGCPSYNGRECWKRWKRATFSGTLTYRAYFAYSEPGWEGFTEEYFWEERWSGFLLHDPTTGDIDPSSTVKREVRTRAVYDSEDTGWGEWEEWDPPGCGTPSPVIGGVIGGGLPSLDRTPGLTTYDIAPGEGYNEVVSDPDFSSTIEASYGGSLHAELSDEDTEADVAARTLASTSILGPPSSFGQQPALYAARPTDTHQQHGMRAWIGIREDYAPGQEWRVYYEIVRKKLGLRLVGAGDITGSSTQTSQWDHTITLSDEMTAPEDALGSLAAEDESWDQVGWEAGAASATASFAQRAWLRVVAFRADVLSVRLKKVQTGEADSYVTVTTSPQADGVHGTAPVWVSILDHTRTATISVEWVRDAAGVDVPAADWAFVRKVRTGAWGRRQWDHATTQASSRFFRRQTLDWIGTASASGGTVAEGSCGELLDLEQAATFEKVWSPAGGWPARWTLLSASGSQGATTWPDTELIGSPLNSTDLGVISRGFVRVEDDAGVGYTIKPAGRDLPPATSDGNWTVAAEVASFSITNDWGFNSVTRVIRGDVETGEVVSRELASGVTDSTRTVFGFGGGTTADYRVFEVAFHAEEEGEMKFINVLWAEPVG